MRFSYVVRKERGKASPGALVVSFDSKSLVNPVHLFDVARHVGEMFGFFVVDAVERGDYRTEFVQRFPEFFFVVDSDGERPVFVSGSYRVEHVLVRYSQVPADAVHGDVALRHFRFLRSKHGHIAPFESIIQSDLKNRLTIPNLQATLPIARIRGRPGTVNPRIRVPEWTRASARSS